MAKSKKGLKLAEVVLIIEVIIGIVAAFVVYLLGSTGAQTSIQNIVTSMQYALFTVTFSAVNLGGFHLSASGIVLAIFAYINLLILLALIINIARSKMSRHLVALFGYLFGFVLALFAGAFFLIIARPVLAVLTLLKKALVVGLLIVVFLVYVMALFCAIAAFVGASKDVSNKKRAAEEDRRAKERDAKIAEKQEKIDALERRVSVLEAALLNGTVAAKPAEPVKEEKKEEPKPEPVAEPEPEPEEEAEEKESIERIPFTTKLSKSEKDIKDKYNELKAYLLSYGVKSRVSVSGDTFRLHKKTYAIIAVAGKHLKVYLPLNFDDYKTSTIPVVDASHFKKYQDTPVAINVRSDLSVRRAKILINDVMHAAGFEQGELVEKNYASQAIKAAKAK